MTQVSKTEVIVFGGGCFWCIEAVFKQLHGIVSVTSGYAGGELQNPTYVAVCGGDTGHAEVVRITYRPGIVNFSDLLEIFFSVHDPTQVNRQGGDVGGQYRSVIYYTTEAQRKIVSDFIKKATTAKLFKAKIVTEVKPLTRFYPAEDYHQDYFAKNPDQAYCQAVINPKLEKFRAKFEAFLKAN